MLWLLPNESGGHGAKRESKEQKKAHSVAEWAFFHAKSEPKTTLEREHRK